MFNKYLVTNSNNNQVLFLYVNDSFEFSNDRFTNLKINNIYDKVKRFINDSNINFNGDRVNFIKNGITLGYIDLSDYDFNYNRYIEVIDPYYDNKLVTFSKSLDIINDLKLEEYIIGVVSCEMPALFNEEALKAQAVIARTYAIKRLSRNLPINNLNETQIYRDKNYLKEIWQDNYNKYRNKIVKAVRDTKNQVIMYDGDLIDVYYHLASSGKTEDASSILKISYPYLVSVDSNNKSFNNYKIVSNDYLSKVLNMDINKDTKVDILIKTIGHRVKYIKFDDKVFDGLLLSRKLCLNSNDFTVEIGPDYTRFNTYGYGHGLGLSKYGANEMANNGYNYVEILNHYYPNTIIKDYK